MRGACEPLRWRGGASARTRGNGGTFVGRRRGSSGALLPRADAFLVDAAAACAQTGARGG